MTCNCGNGDTPEYYITLDGVGVDGYSPEVNIVDENTASFKIEVVNKSNTQETLAIPKLSYIQNTYVSNTSLVSTLSAYSTTAQMNTALAGKLNTDGSNASANITINNLPIKTYSGTGSRIGDGGNLSYLAVQSRDVRLQNYNSSGSLLASIQLTNGNVSITANDKASYKGYEIATLNDIPTVGNGTITLTQGGVTKGTFTTNQSGNTTISLDSGVTNPLMLNAYGEAGTGYIEIKAGSTGAGNEIVFGQNTGGGTLIAPLICIGAVDSPISVTDHLFGTKKLSVNTMTGSDSITGGAAGLVPAPSAGDQDKFLKGDGTWDTVGGGGSSYTAGTGIDITNDVISVKNAQSFAKVTIANGYNTGEGLYGWLDDGSSTIPLVRVSDLDDVIIGDGGSKLVLHGDETRPSYFNGQTTSYLALYSDIPDVSNFVTSSSLATTLAGYVDLTSNQTVGGNKTFTGTNYLRNTYICNASGTYFGRMRAVDNKFTFEGIGTNRSINFIPDGTGELQYNGNEVATVNDIPDVSQLQEKLTAGDGVNIQYNYTPPIVEGLPITLDNSNSIVKVLSYDKAKDDITLTFVVTTSTFTGNFMIAYSDNNAETSLSNGIRMDRYNDGSVTQSVGIATMYYGNLGDNLATISASPFNDAGSIYLKLVIHNDSTVDFSYSLDGGITYSTSVSVGGIAGSFHEKYVYMGRGSGQSTVTNVMSNETESVNLISCDDTIQRKLTATGGIKIEPNGSIKVNPLIALPYTASESSTDKIFNASDTTVDGTEICGKWDASSVIVFSNNVTALQFGYGFYWNNNSIIAMARLNGQYNGLATIGGVSYQSDFWYKIKFFEDGTVDMYYSTDGITYNLAISTTAAVGGDLYGQDIYVCGGNGSTLSEAYLSIPSANPIISLDPITIQGYSSTGTLYLKLVDGVLQWTA